MTNKVVIISACLITLIIQISNGDQYDNVKKCMNEAKTVNTMKYCAGLVQTCIKANACDDDMDLEFPFFMRVRSPSEVAEDLVGLRLSATGAAEGLIAYLELISGKDQNGVINGDADHGVPDKTHKRSGLSDLLPHFEARFRAQWCSCASNAEYTEQMKKDVKRLEADTILCFKARQCSLQSGKIVRAYVENFKLTSVIMDTIQWALGKMMAIASTVVAATTIPENTGDLHKTNAAITGSSLSTAAILNMESSSFEKTRMLDMMKGIKMICESRTQISKKECEMTKKTGIVIEMYKMVGDHLRGKSVEQQEEFKRGWDTFAKKLEKDGITDLKVMKERTLVYLKSQH